MRNLDSRIARLEAAQSRRNREWIVLYPGDPTPAAPPGSTIIDFRESTGPVPEGCVHLRFDPRLADV